MRTSLLTHTAGLLSIVSAASLKNTLQQHESLSSITHILEHLEYFDYVETQEDVTFLALTNTAISYLTKFGIDLTKIDPALAKGILDYHLLEGVYTTSKIAESNDATIAHSVLKPPFLTNVTAGPMVKFQPQSPGSNVVVESGLQSLTPIIESDIKFDNGVVHTVDFNLVVPHNLSETLTVGEMTGFLDLIHQSGLLDELDWLVDATYFFPDDEAVKKAERGLRSLSKAELRDVVASHAIPKNILTAASLKREESFTTLAGTEIKIRRDDEGNISVNGVQVKTQNVLMYGGIAHIVNGVIVPEELQHEANGSPTSTIGRPSSCEAIDWRAIVIHLSYMLAVAGVFWMVYTSLTKRQTERGHIKLPVWVSDKNMLHR